MDEILHVKLGISTKYYLWNIILSITFNIFSCSQCARLAIHCYQGLSLWEIWSKHSQSFDVWRTLTATGVKGYRNRVTCIRSGHETSGSSDAMHTPGVTQQILSEIANQKLKMSNFGVWMRGHCPLWPPLIPI